MVRIIVNEILLLLFYMHCFRLLYASFLLWPSISLNRQVEIEEEDKEMAAFKIGGLIFYEFKRMSFGLCNAPAMFQRLMEERVWDLIFGDCLIYLDDIVIFSLTFQVHPEHLEVVWSKVVALLLLICF